MGNPMTNCRPDRLSRLLLDLCLLVVAGVALLLAPAGARETSRSVTMQGAAHRSSAVVRAMPGPLDSGCQTYCGPRHDTFTVPAGGVAPIAPAAVALTGAATLPEPPALAEAAPPGRLVEPPDPPPNTLAL
jgi:hypothetical protein